MSLVFEESEENSPYCSCGLEKYIHTNVQIRICAKTKRLTEKVDSLIEQMNLLMEERSRRLQLPSDLSH